MATTTTNLGLYKPAVNDAVDADLWGGYLNQNMDTIDGEFATKTINQNFADKVLSRPLLKDYGEVVYNHSSVSGGVTVDITNGNHQKMTLTGNVTFTFSNPSPTGNACALILSITQNATGGWTAAWPASVKWPGSVAPTLTSTGAKRDRLMFYTDDAGTTWDGSVLNQNYG